MGTDQWVDACADACYTDSEVGAIDVGGDYGQTVALLPSLGQSKRKERALVAAAADPLSSHDRFAGRADGPGEVVLSVRLEIPLVLLADLWAGSDDARAISGRAPDTRTLEKPALSRMADASATAWNGVGDALTKSRRRWAASGPSWVIMVMVREQEGVAGRGYLCAWGLRNPRKRALCAWGSAGTRRRLRAGRRATELQSTGWRRNIKQPWKYCQYRHEALSNQRCLALSGSVRKQSWPSLQNDST